jgi:hypothetical protein
MSCGLGRGSILINWLLLPRARGQDQGSLHRIDDGERIDTLSGKVHLYFGTRERRLDDLVH